MGEVDPAIPGLQGIEVTEEAGGGVRALPHRPRHPRGTKVLIRPRRTSPMAESDLAEVMAGAIELAMRPILQPL
eukprot:1522290-Alexandrium_andersonii.AAC.1